MTKQVARKITQYAFKPTDRLLLDANVWLLVYGPVKPGDKRVAVYSRALNEILKAKSKIYIDVLIVSEFVNAYARVKYYILRPNPSQTFKAFRNTAAFRRVARDIAADVRRVLKHCTRIESAFAKLDIDALTDEYKKGACDFNDQVLTELCKRRGLKLVTDDGDFQGRGLAVLTANKRMLP